MLFLIGIAAALLVGKLAGGRFKRLEALGVKWWWAMPIALGVQLFVVYGPRGLDNAALIALIVGSHVALLAIGLRNWRIAGARIATVGVTMNLAVMLANGGLMPIAPETLVVSGRVESWKVGDGSPGTRLTQSKDVIVPRDETRLELLADRFWTGLPGRLNIVFSLGDVVLLAGVGTLIVRGMTARGNQTPIVELEGHNGTDRAGRGRAPEAAAVC